MGTLNGNVSARRIALLAKKNEVLFHTHDLATLWGIYNPNTLRITLKRYVDQGLLYRLHRGFYSLVPLDEIDPLLLGARALHSFCYVSTETVLFQAGIINQAGYVYTLVSNRSSHFRIGTHYFRSRQLNDRYLYNPAGIIQENGILTATKERAVADLLYFNPLAYFDELALIDAKNVCALQKEIGYPLTPLSDASPS